MKISKIYLRVCSLLFVCFLACGSILRPVVTYASPYDLMINTDSNALMTLELDDSEYLLMSPRSSIGTVSNTIDSDHIDIMIVTYNMKTGGQINNYVRSYKNNGRYDLKYTALDDYKITSMQIIYDKSRLPAPGSYLYSFDMGSQFSNDIADSALIWEKASNNVEVENGVHGITGFTSVSSGDVYISNVALDIGSISSMRQYFAFRGTVYNLDFSFATSFVKTGSSGADIGPSYSSGDYENDVSSSLSDLSSSVDSMTEDLSSAAQNLEYISTSQNLIIQGIDNVIMHISDQLFAFWDQLFNLIHLPTLAKMDDIISAINNMDLEIEVNLDGLKTTINNMSTAVQNKLQSTTDKITGGYDNTGITQENEKLEQSINQYDDVESGIFEDAEGFIGDFEYPSVDSLPLGIIKALAFVGSFLQGIFLCMGEFSVIITFSLTMIFVMVVVGYHRIRS